MEKIFFNEGDLVVLKGLPSPTMMVKRINRVNIKEVGNKLLGIKVCWFTTTNEYQEAIFSSKDLKHA